MSMGLPPNDPALPQSLRALLAAAAPDPLPADQAIALLKQSGETDPMLLGRLAYQALTGVDPGPVWGKPPEPPTALFATFPPFASEVLMRAITGPDERRPTAQALLIVLETVPAGSWPSAGRPHLTVVEEPATVVEDAAQPTPDVEDAAQPTPDVEDAAQPTPDVEEVAQPTPDVEEVAQPTPDVEEVAQQPSRDAAAAPARSRAARDDEFRSLLLPSRPVPRFDPLTDPWDTDADGPAIQAPLLEQAPDVALSEPRPEPRPEPSPEPAVAAEPEATPTPRPLSARLAELGESSAAKAPRVESRGMHEEFRGLAASDTAVEPTPKPDVPDVPDVADVPDVPGPTNVATAPTEPAEPAAAAEPRGMHEEFRDLVAPNREIPTIEPLDGADTLPEARPRRRRSSGSRPRTVTTYDDPGDRKQVLILVAVVAVLIVLGILYASTRDAGDDTKDTGDPQGASRSSTQPLS